MSAVCLTRLCHPPLRQHLAYTYVVDAFDGLRVARFSFVAVDEGAGVAAVGPDKGDVAVQTNAAGSTGQRRRPVAEVRGGGPRRPGADRARVGRDAPLAVRAGVCRKYHSVDSRHPVATAALDVLSDAQPVVEWCEPRMAVAKGQPLPCW